MPAIVVSTSGGGQPGCSSGSHLVDSVASVIGGVDETNVRVQALDCINRARNEINMHDWRFLKRAVTSTAFMASTATYTLATTFKSPSFFRVLDSNGKPYRDLTYVDDISMTHAVPQQTQVGVPTLYSLRNTFNDGLITFYPVPNASTVAGYTWAGEYYTRVAEITDDSTALSSIPEEICNVIVAGGQYFLVAEREKANTPLLNLKLGDYQRVKNLALVNDRRMTDETARFRLRTPRNFPFITNTNDYYGWFTD